MSSSRVDFLSSMRELEATLQVAPDLQTRRNIELQLASMRSMLDLLDRTEAAQREIRAARPALSEEVAAFFQPERPAPIPAWLPDTLRREEVTEAMLACPPGARIYWEELWVGCARPGIPGQTLSRDEGLSLRWHRASRHLESQRFYRDDRLVWTIDYHPTGGRALVGGYALEGGEGDMPEHGLHTRYHSNGVVAAQTHWDRGVREGWSKIWEDDGYPVVATRYQRGREVESLLPDGRRLPSS